MTMRKLACSFLITIILSMAFLIPYFKVSTFYSYAAIDDDQLYEPLRQQSDLVKAFQAYCKSRDLTVEGSALDAVTTWTTSAFNTACNNVGLNMTQIQAEIKAQYDSNGQPFKFLFYATGVDAFNRIFAQFLQDNELEVGDSANQTDNTVYDGEYFVDRDGVGCLIYVMPQMDNKSQNGIYPIKYGTTYRYNGIDLKNLYNSGQRSVTFNLNDTLSVDFPLSYYQDINRDGLTDLYKITDTVIGFSGWYFTICSAVKDGYSFHNEVIIYKYGNRYFLGGMLKKQGAPFLIDFGWNHWVEISSVSQNVTPANIYITTFNQTINNNTYEGDTIINYPDGTVDIPEDDPNDPYNPYPDNPDYDPTDPNSPPGTITPPTDPSNPPDGSGGGTITFPDIDLNLPEINWSIGDLTEKFPFSIPFDLIAFFTVLNAAPEAPAIDADIPLGDWYTWHFEADFSQYDNWAALIRNVEFIAFCVGLIYLTVRFVKG